MEKQESTVTLKRGELSALVNGFSAMRIALMASAPKFAPGSIGFQAVAFSENPDGVLSPILEAMKEAQ